MDKFTGASEYTSGDRSDDTAAAAQSVHADFTALLSILDHQLANVADTDDRARAHILEARTAAKRGLDLSARLVGLLRTAEAKN
jgi:hypothetical protein